MGLPGFSHFGFYFPKAFSFSQKEKLIEPGVLPTSRECVVSCSGVLLPQLLLTIRL